MITYNFNLRVCFWVILTFIIFTIVGTLSHELGHIAVAKYLGYETYLSYGSMTYYQKGYQNDEDVKEFEILNDKYIKEGITTPEQLETHDLSHFNNLISNIEKKFPNNKRHSLLITLGGPAQTVLTCLIGLLILYFRKSKRYSSFRILDWLGVFLGLFILREVFNTTMAIFKTLIFGSTQFYGDEFRMSTAFNLNQWVVPVITMIVGVIISIYIIFKVIPMRYRFSFLVAGLIGGILGYGIWFGFLGELLFPYPISF